ncbi:Uncharacterized protein Adt_37569 [Abeliophyllum distichum]|uniref:Uncharacterized protein n=1 Tax=Abeliophyllum distichum TaxID=126358 RepID=A0ABD1Q1F1_9LAMI
MSGTSLQQVETLWTNLKNFESLGTGLQHLEKGFVELLGKDEASLKQILIDHFKLRHRMKVGSTLRFAIEDFVSNLVCGTKKSSSPETSFSSLTPSSGKVEAHIQSDMDCMGLGDCTFNMEDDPPSADSRTSSEAQRTYVSTYKFSKFRHEAPPFHMSPSGAHSPRRAHFLTSSYHGSRSPEDTDYYDEDSYITKHMWTRSGIRPHEYH